MEPGKQYTITWTGILVSSISLVLFNSTDQTSTILETLENTGSYNWDVPLSEVVGSYSLSLLAVDQGLLTPSVTFFIKEPVFAGEPSIALQDIDQSIISEGDSVTIYYTSEVSQEFRSIHAKSFA